MALAGAAWGKPVFARVEDRQVVPTPPKPKLVAPPSAPSHCPVPTPHAPPLWMTPAISVYTPKSCCSAHFWLQAGVLHVTLFDAAQSSVNEQLVASGLARVEKDVAKRNSLLAKVLCLARLSVALPLYRFATLSRCAHCT